MESGSSLAGPSPGENHGCRGASSVSLHPAAGVAPDALILESAAFASWTGRECVVAVGRLLVERQNSGKRRTEAQRGRADEVVGGVRLLAGGREGSGSNGHRLGIL